MQCRRAAGVGEVDVAQLELAAQVVAGFQQAGALALVVGVEDGEEAFGVGEGLVHLVVDAVELPDGSRHVVEQQDVEHDGADRNLAVEYEVGREDDDDDHANLLDEGFEAVVAEVGFAGHQLGVHQLGLGVGLLFGLVGLAHEAFNNHNRVDEGDEAVVFAFAQLLQAAAHPLQAVGLPEAQPEIHRQNGQRHHPHPFVGHEHHHQRHQGVGKQRQDVDEEVLHQLHQALHAPVDAGLELAGLVALIGEKAQFVTQNLADGRLREHAGNVDTDFLAVVFLPEGDESVDDFLAQQNAAHPGQHGPAGAQAQVAVEQALHRVHGVT